MPKKSFFKRKKSGKDDGPVEHRKLVVVGDGSCGKTSLLFAFTKDQFYEEYVPTVFETSVTELKIKEGNTVELSLWDTAGQEAYQRLRPLSYPDTNVMLICFAMDNTDSLLNIREIWYPEVKHFCPKAALMLVGCKSDLASDSKTCVSQADVDRLATDLHADAVFTCSAKTRDNITEVFETAASLSYHNGASKDKKGCTLL